MPLWITLAVSGAIVGFLYALMAFGVVLIYRSTGVLNFAHATMGSFLALLFQRIVNEWGWPKLPALLFVVVVLGGLSGLAFYYLVFYPLRDKGVLNQVVATLALTIVLTSLSIRFTGSSGLASVNIFSAGTVKVAGIFLSWQQIGSAVLAVIIAVLLTLFFRRTRTGLAVLALSESRVGAQLVGIPIRRMEALVWAVGTALAGLAGILLAPLLLLALGTALPLMVKVFAAALVGGLLSYGGAVFGALLLGITEAEFAGYVTSSNLRESLPFFLVMLALIARPLLTDRGSLSATMRAIVGRTPESDAPSPADERPADEMAAM